MKKAVVALICLFSLTSFASDIAIGDSFSLKKDIRFLTMDGSGIMNLVDHFVDKETVEKGVQVIVTQVSEPRIHTEFIHARSIKSCERTITLEIQDCRLRTDLFMEQNIEFGSPRTRMDLVTSQKSCLIRYNERMEVFCDRKESLIGKSKFSTFFGRN